MKKVGLIEIFFNRYDCGLLQTSPHTNVENVPAAHIMGFWGYVGFLGIEVFVMHSVQKS